MRNGSLVRVLRLQGMLSTGRHTIDALAQKFGVTTRTIRRDLRALSDAGCVAVRTTSHGSGDRGEGDRAVMVDRMTETALLQALLLRGSQLGARLFRNNCGVLQDARGNYVRYGVANPGGSDLIGWMPVTVTPEMVGQTLAVFLAIEAKRPRGNLRAEQRQFLKVVTEAGAVSGVVRSVEDLETLLAPWLR